MVWRVMYITRSGVYFQGLKSLVEGPGDAVVYESFDEAADVAKETHAYNLDGVVQVRIISDAFVASQRGGTGGEA